MAPSSGLGSFFILRRRGVEQHGRPQVRTMIWTNNLLDESGCRLRKTETAAWFIIFDYFFVPGKTRKNPAMTYFFWLRFWLQSTRQKQAVSDTHRQQKNPRNIDFSSTFRGYFLVRGRGFEPPRINHTHLKRARLPVPPPSHMKFWCNPCFLTALRFKPYRWLLKYNTILPRRCQAFS